MQISNDNLTTLTAAYASALRKYLKQGSGSLQPARRLGQQAVSFGLETLDVTKIHEAALAALQGSESRRGMIKRAEIFFKESVTPIERTHPAAIKADGRLNEANKRLRQRTADLAASQRCLKRNVVRRKNVEGALKTSGKNSRRLLAESQRLQKHLRHLTHKILDAHEDKRTKVSRELQDEIAQTLLGINVRLLTLKKEASIGAKSLKKDIASTQRLVERAGKSIERLVHEIRKHYEA